ncbi:MAG: hypothetical protein WBA97_31045 [Actinophytocola sp.]
MIMRLGDAAAAVSDVLDALENGVTAVITFLKHPVQLAARVP